MTEFFGYNSPFDGNAFECNFCHQKLRILRYTGYAAVVDPANTDNILFASHAPCPELQKKDIQMKEERERENDLKRIEKKRMQEEGAKKIEEQFARYRQEAFDARMKLINKNQQLNNNKNLDSSNYGQDK